MQQSRTVAKKGDNFGLHKKVKQTFNANRNHHRIRTRNDTNKYIEIEEESTTLWKEYAERLFNDEGPSQPTREVLIENRAKICRDHR